jgi:hypothetical protein
VVDYWVGIHARDLLSLDLEVVGIDSLRDVRCGAGHANVVLDHQTGELLAADQDDLFAG